MAEQRVKGLEALGKLVPTSFVLQLGSLRFDPADAAPPLMVGDEVTIAITARVVSAEVAEKFSASSNQFTGSLRYTTKAAPVDVGITGHRTRKEIEAEFVERVRR